MFRCNFHCFFIQCCVHNTFAVFTDSRNSLFDHPFNICQSFTGLPFGYCTNLKYMHGSQFCCFVMHISDPIPLVNDRFRIRHCKNRSKPTLCSCLGSGNNILFIGQSRISQMDMKIDQPRHYITSTCINHFIPVGWSDVFTYLLYLSAFNIKIAYLIRTGCRIYNATILN